jgi:multidrug efflux pump
LAVFALPTANALATGEGVKKKMEELKKRFPEGLDYRIAYDTTPFIEHSVEDVINTIYIAAALVIVVVLVFLQDWHAMLLPLIDNAVALIGTMVVIKALGFSLNNLSLFSLVLAVGIVVDDSIVVVENIEQWMGKGLPAREATIKAMDEITGPVIGITLVLAAVSDRLHSWTEGQFFRQFALTIASAAFFSATNALTMAPARAVAWIKPHGAGHEEVKEALPRVGVALLFGFLTYYLLGGFVESPLTAALGSSVGDAAALWMTRAILFAPGAVAGWFLSRLVNQGLGWFFGLFNRAFDIGTRAYKMGVSLSLRLSIVVLINLRLPAGPDRVRFRYLTHGLHSRPGPGVFAGQRGTAPRGFRAANPEVARRSGRHRHGDQRGQVRHGRVRLFGRFRMRLFQLGHNLRHSGRLLGSHHAGYSGRRDHQESQPTLRQGNP